MQMCNECHKECEEGNGWPDEDGTHYCADCWPQSVNPQDIEEYEDYHENNEYDAKAEQDWDQQYYAEEEYPADAQAEEEYDWEEEPEYNPEEWAQEGPEYWPEEDPAGDYPQPEIPEDDVVPDDLEAAAAPNEDEERPYVHSFSFCLSINVSN